MALRDYFYRFGLALSIGLLVGIQREAAYDSPEGKLFAGARTFALISLSGFVLAFASAEAGSALPFALGLLVLGSLLGLAYWADVSVGKPGMTTEISAVVMFGTGGLCYWGQISLAAALGVTVTALLSFKHEFRSLTHAITREDIYAAVTFAVVAVIVLPILPNRTYGPVPLNVLNPHNLWLMVVFVSGISFVGYVLIKFIGARRAVGLTGLLGGLASSTALTISFSRRSKDNPELSRAFALGIVLAWAVMFVRVIVIVLMLAPYLVPRVFLPLGVSTIVGLFYSAYLYYAQSPYTPESVEFENPFNLGPALRFGAIYAVVLLISRMAQVSLGDLGVYASSFVSGLVDADAIILSTIELARQSKGLTPVVATRAIVIATTANTLFKGGFALATGSTELRRYLWPGLTLMLIAGIVMLVVA